MTGRFLRLKWNVNLPRVYRCCMFWPYTELPLLEVLVRAPCEWRPMHNLPHLYAVPFITRYSMLLTQFGKKMDEEDCMPPSLSNSTIESCRWCSTCNFLIHQHVTVLQKSLHCVHTCMVTTTDFCNSDLLDYKERCYQFTVLHWKRNLNLNVYPRAF